VAAERLPDVGGRELRNDDMILQTCLHAQRAFAAPFRAAGHRAAVFLLSNDRGLCVRAAANGVDCLTAHEFPRTPEGLAARVPAAEAADMEAAAGGAPAAAFPQPGGEFSGSPVGPPPIGASRAPHPSPAVAPPAAFGEAAAAAQARAAAAAASLRLQQAQHEHLSAGLHQLQLHAQQAAAERLYAEQQQQQQQQQAQQQAIQQQQAQQAQLLQQQQPSPGTGGLVDLGIDPHQAAAMLAHLQAGHEPTPQMLRMAQSIHAHHAAQAQAAQEAAQQQAEAAAAYAQATQAAPGRRQQRQQQPGAPPPRRAAPPPDPGAAVEALCSVVERCLAPGVKHVRQQDLGDLWLDMLGEDVRPPWDAGQVLRVMDSHNTSFW
jgi:hypothetical protein